MKKLITLFVILLFYTSIFSQNQNVDAQQILVRSNFRIPVRDTTFLGKFDKEWVIRPQDGKTYQFNATAITGPKWTTISGSGEGGTIGLSNIGVNLPLFKGFNGETGEFRTIRPLFGLIGTTNPTDVSLQVDSNQVTSKYVFNKTRDSLGIEIGAKVNIADTSYMLAPYFKRPTGTAGQYVRGDGTLATLPTLDSAGVGVTEVGSDPYVGNLLTINVSNPTTTPNFNFEIQNASPYVLWGNPNGSTGSPTYFTPVLSSSLFRNQGTPTQLLIGNDVGNPTWGKVNLSSMTIGILPVTAFNNGINASGSTFLAGDGTWKPVSGGGGDVTTDSQTFIATSGQTDFTTSFTLPTDNTRITVTRNGTKIGFTKISNTVTIPASFSGDEIIINAIL